MKIFFRINVLIAFCCGVLCATPAESKVCFAGDGDCGGIETFGGYTDPTENLKNQCAKAGYETNRSECTANKGLQVTDYCPYDSNFVKCCSMEYQYDSCVYPLVQAGKCGNKYKCVCDTSKYKYTVENCRTSFANSNASGASCAQVEYNSSSRTTSTRIFFTDCSCNEALYPYKPEDCKDGTAPTGDVCYGINVNGVREIKYASCLCNRDIYPHPTSYCDNPSNDRWGGDDSKKCIQGGVTYFANCLTCGSSYPAKSKANVDGAACRYLADVKRTEEVIDPSRIVTIGGTQYYKPYASATCGYAECPYGDRYKILKCGIGYKTVNGGACQELTCAETVQDYLNRNTEKAKEWEIFKKVPGQKKFQIVTDDITPTYLRKGKTYYSGYAFGVNVGSDVIKERCKKQAMPVITWGDRSFSAPSSGQSSTEISFQNIGLDFTSSITMEKTLTWNCSNCKINYRNELIIWGPAKFTKDVVYYNADTMPALSINSKVSFNDTRLTSNNEMLIKAQFSSVGYNYDIHRIAVIAPLSSSVFFQGESNSNRMTMNTEHFIAQGTIGFKNANIYPNISCIGCHMDRSGNTTSPGGVAHSSVNLYNSDWYLYGSSGRYFTVRILAGCFLGNAYEDGLVPVSRTSNLKYQDGTNYPYLAQPTQYSKCSRCSRGYVMSATGQVINIGAYGSDCGRWCQSANKPKEYADDKVCYVNGAKGRGGVQGGKDGWLVAGFAGGRC